jgi:hypothetical protein
MTLLGRTPVFENQGDRGVRCRIRFGLRSDVCATEDRCGPVFGFIFCLLRRWRRSGVFVGIGVVGLRSACGRIVVQTGVKVAQISGGHPSVDTVTTAEGVGRAVRTAITNVVKATVTAVGVGRHWPLADIDAAGVRAQRERGMSTECGCCMKSRCSVWCESDAAVGRESDAMARRSAALCACRICCQSRYEDHHKKWLRHGLHSTRTRKTRAWNPPRI